MRTQTLIKEQHYSRQLHGLTQAALAINATLSVEEVLQVITEQAYQIIGTHQSVTSLTIDQNWAQAINAVYLSDKYAQWQDYNDQTDGSGIYACVCHLNRSMRMTQAELEAHPRWKGFGEAADRHPPMRGWLVAPLVGRDGRNIGLIQLSDKYEGEFTEEDEAILVQLAQMASVAVENTRLYEAQQRARTQAESANRIKDEFLAVLSHELRSPLNPILGWARLLRERKLDEKATDRALATIERNAKLQTQLIEDLLDVSRILQGKLSLNVCPVNLPSIIKAAMETVRLAAEAKSIEIQMRFKPAIGQVAGDSTRLQQVVWNLLSNAVKFTPTGGQIEITLEQIASEAQIQVRDTGKGISPDFLPHVFEYFRQADSTTTRKFGGLGLGLAIVRQLVELHGGTVAADSPGEGQGATFTVRLPLRRESATPKDETATTNLFTTVPDTLPLTNIRILVVDDEADSLDFLAFVLEQAGAEVTATASAIAALQLLTQSKPDILISDIGMPEMDGYMLMRQVRLLESEQENNIAAIALTAYAGEMNQQQALAAGFQRHIAKPVDPETLVQQIKNMVNCI
nr:ATP-binding protein [Microcoleus sp. FACHB-68]